ncbi:molybdopterin synthase catalytic subunit [Hordeum vulgare]|nr:molybdopterin synthase catalytic subunit [Hordeum vulgare]
MAGDEAPTTEAACQDLVEILDEGSGRLDMGRYVDHVHDLSAGAIATFEGTTRGHFDGRRVVELRYEAYGSMARRQLEAILREARAAHALCRLAVAHRLETVPAGEASVFVAAAEYGFGSERRWYFINSALDEFDLLEFDFLGELGLVLSPVPVGSKMPSGRSSPDHHHHHQQ